jgi:hypothetical protein
LRRAKKLGTSNEERISRAAVLVNYFQNLAQSPDEISKGGRLFEWNLGLFLARQFLELLKSDTPNLYDLRRLVKILGENLNEFGSGWCDLYYQSKHFLDSIETESR